MAMNLFASLEQRVNNAVERRLANAQAVYLGGEPFGVVLDRTTSNPLDGTVDVATITVGYCVANTPGIHEGCELRIDGVAHTVSGQVQPDAGGWVELSVHPKA